MALRGAILTLGAALGLAGVGAAETCRSVTWEGVPFVVCDIDMTTADLRLFHSDASGALYGQFPAIDVALRREGRRLAFAMNAGMYHQDRRPVGLYVENGAEHAPLVTSRGPGNFGMLPNGVLCIADGRARVIETRLFARTRPDCRFATQSGPMLVIDGALHPRFLPDSDSTYTRNGVGTSANGKRAVFALADQPVSFHRFARFFRDALGVPDALYLDGSVSRVWAPGLNRADFGFAMGPVVGLTVPDN